MDEIGTKQQEREYIKTMQEINNRNENFSNECFLFIKDKQIKLNKSKNNNKKIYQKKIFIFDIKNC